MNLLDKVSTIMSTKLITIKEDEPLTRVQQIFKEHRIHHIPVVAVNRLLGIVSKSDFLFFKRGFNEGKDNSDLEQIRLRTHYVSDIMTKNIATINKDEKINVALEIFKENLFHAIPIMDEDRIVGIITTFDIIRKLADDKGAESKY